jgi:membrane-associated phospholipid phosphatase
MRHRGALALAGWFVILGAGCVAAFLALVHFFVRTERGQWIEWIALTGNSIGQARIDDLVATVLNAMSVVSLAIAAAMVAFIALVRGRRALALAVLLLIAGANLTTQVAKAMITRPYLGVDIERAAAGNSLPSGHTTVAASVAVALVLVLPPRVRTIGAFCAAGYTALAGAATMSAGWHRPSDAMAALLIVCGWTAAVSILLLLARRHDDYVNKRDAHRVAAGLLVLAGILLLVLAVAAMELTEIRDIDPTELGRRRLFAAYAGGAAGISGTASLLMGLTLLTVHRVVPQRGGLSQEPAVPPAVRGPAPEPPTVVLRDPVAEAPTVRISGTDDPTVPQPQQPRQ